MLPQLEGLARKDPGSWEEVIFKRKELLKLLQISSEKRFSCDLEHGRKVVDLLVRFESFQLVVRDVKVLPHDIKVDGVFFPRDPPV